MNGMISTDTPLPNTSAFRDLFLLRRDIAFLNHGSFGACPRVVFAAYQQWQRRLEEQPVEFLGSGRQFEPLMRTARQRLAAYLNVDADDLVYHVNSTTALNQVAKSLELGPDDEVLGTDHEYGALDRTWRYLQLHGGARYVRAQVAVPLTSEEDVVEQIWSQVSPRTRALFISHVTSATALTLPVGALCARARSAGIISIVDGAHAPSYLSLDLRRVDADFYAGNCHKWLSAPKGSAFLCARRDVQRLLKPLVVSWGWESEHPSGSRFVDENEYQATRDISAFLSVAAAIDFQQSFDWDAVRTSCRGLVLQARDRIMALTGLSAIAPAEGKWFSQMCALRLPACDVAEIKRRLYDEFQVEVPVYMWNDRPYLRVSVQAYNTQEDIDRLLEALGTLLRTGKRCP